MYAEHLSRSSTHTVMRCVFATDCSEALINGAHVALYTDPFALDGTAGGGDGVSTTNLLLALFMMLIVGVMLQMGRSTRKVEDTVDCRPMNRDRNDRDFEPPEID